METITRNLLTTEQAIENEVVQMLDAFFSGCFDEPRKFLNDHLNLITAPIKDDKDLLFLLDGLEKDSREGSYYETNPDLHIGPIGEIEIQFEGEPKDYFADPDDWYIDKDLAYCTMHSVVAGFDYEKVKEAVADWVTE
tara:strand:+ start:112 stop:525 length:414 start_codon:yes stop_codon:yes gene_type:complete